MIPSSKTGLQDRNLFEQLEPEPPERFKDIVAEPSTEAAPPRPIQKKPEPQSQTAPEDDPNFDWTGVVDEDVPADTGTQPAMDHTGADADDDHDLDAGMFNEDPLDHGMSVDTLIAYGLSPPTLCSLTPR